MDEHKRAKKNAQARRRDVMKSIEDIQARFTLPRLADDALSLLDPRLSLPGRVTAAATRQPLVSVLLLGGAAWLLTNGTESDKTVPVRKKRTHSSRQQKGDDT